MLRQKTSFRLGVVFLLYKRLVKEIKMSAWYSKGQGIKLPDRVFVQKIVFDVSLLCFIYMHLEIYKL